MTTTHYILLALAIILILLPPHLDPAIRIKERQLASSPKDRQRKHDIAAVNANICPDCGASGSLYEGPKGGMCVNTACDQCLMEFNICGGFGVGALVVERTGRLSRSRGRLFGFTEADFAGKDTAA